MAKKLKLKFWGRTYLWPAPKGGFQEIGVLQSISGGCYVGWIGADGIPTRLNTPHLPLMAKPSQLQERLDEYAAERGLTKG